MLNCCIWYVVTICAFHGAYGARTASDPKSTLAKAREASAAAHKSALRAQRALEEATERYLRQEAEEAAQSNSDVAVSERGDVFLAEGEAHDRHPFEGIGALSAGASSRLLRDYPQRKRDDILDLLFKPGHGASLQVLKVEIGGDMQATDGSEPSHMRTRNEKPDCTRGYETWLMQEAKRRNPEIRTYGLAWGVPGWIGNGSYFSRDNIRYHVSWLQCIRDTFGFEVDYLGIWNEMPWGHVWYVEALAQEMRAQRFKTRLVLLDAIHGVDQGFVDLFSSNATFRSLIDAVGLHYPCQKSEPLASVLDAHRTTRFWASEELSTVADWGGAGCWGRMLNQNFVRMNATSSIAWSLVWSAYPNLECFGNGLLYAYEPWSGSYEVMPPVWVTAHTTQFTQPGWQYLPQGEGAGLLAGGGTFVTIASRHFDHFTVVLETLRGQCFYHEGCYHTKEASGPQTVRLHLGHAKARRLLAAAQRGGGLLEVWSTNQTHWFVRQPDVHIDVYGTITLSIEADSIVTVTTLRNASNRGVRHPEDKRTSVTHVAFGSEGPTQALESSFPIPYEENFNGLSRDPRFFADQGGAFEMVDAGGEERGSKDAGRGNGVLEQRVVIPPIAWIGHSPSPFTLVGGVNWTDVGVQVSVRLHRQPPEEGTDVTQTAGQMPPVIDAVDLHKGSDFSHVGLCTRISRYQFFGGAKATPEGYCLEIVQTAPPQWMLTAGSVTLESGLLEHAGAVLTAKAGWLQLRLDARGARLNAWIGDARVASLIDTAFPFGQVALRCGYHHCQYDDLKIQALEPLPPSPGDRRPLLRAASAASFDYHGRTCDPAPRLARRRTDFTGFVGFSFVPKTQVRVKALGRLSVSGGHPWAKVHNVSLFRLRTDGVSAPRSNDEARSQQQRLIASVALPTEPVDQVGVDQTDDGWVYAQLRQPVLLEGGREYVLVSSELENGDTFYDAAVSAEADEGIYVRGPVYLDRSQTWHRLHEGPVVFGPLNALLAEKTEPVIKRAMGHLRRLVGFGN